jgi:hypothetical protein
MKTSDLTGAALDWAIAQCENFPVRNGFDDNCPEYSTDWSQGGPIIERKNIALGSTPDGLWSAYAPEGTHWIKYADKATEYFHWTYKGQGPTPLIAAMRCYVASKLGDEVEIPEELI